MELVLFLLFAVCIYLWLKIQAGENARNDQPKLDRNIPERVDVDNSPNNPNLPNISVNNSTSIAELDGPGMRHRIHQYPDGHVCYLLYSDMHSAYKFGISRPNDLARRILTIRRNVIDVRLVGTRVFTSYQNAYDAEKAIRRRFSSYRYRGIEGRESGRTEWLTLRPTGRGFNFPTPERVEELFRERSTASLAELEIEDIYTVYLAYSKEKNKYKIKWCRTDNLQERIQHLRTEVPDAEVRHRIPFDNRDNASRVCIDMNRESGALSGQRRGMHFHWIEEPSCISVFQRWTADGERRN